MAIKLKDYEYSLNTDKEPIKTQTTNNKTPTKIKLSDYNYQLAPQPMTNVKQPIKNDNTNFGSKLLGTSTYLSGSLLKGAAGSAEGIVDAGASLLQRTNLEKQLEVAQKTGDLKRVKGIQQILSNISTTQKNQYDKNITNANKGITNFIQKDLTKFIDDPITKNQQQVNRNLGTFLGDNPENSLATKVATGIGGMIPSLAAPVSTIATMGFSAGGSATEEALNKGADLQTARKYGVVKGLIEAGTEKIFGGLGKAFGKGALDDVLVGNVTKRISNSVLKNITDVGLKSVGEGIEEVLSGVLTPIAQKLTYEDKTKLSKLYQDTNLLEDFIVGMATSAVMQLPSGVSNTKKDIQDKKNHKLAAEIEKKTGIKLDIQKLAEPQTKIKNELGTTTDFNKAGYILDDGTMINMSKDGKIIDHTEIKSTDKDALLQSGAIRIGVKPDTGVIEMGLKPSLDNLYKITEFANQMAREGKDFNLELSDGQDTTFNVYTNEDINPTQIRNDITRYYDNGIKLGERKIGPKLIAPQDAIKTIPKDTIAEQRTTPNMIQGQDVQTQDNIGEDRITEQEDILVGDIGTNQQQTTQQTPEGQSRFVKTAANSQVADAKLKQVLDNTTANYVPIQDQDALDNANTKLSENGYNESINYINTKFNSNEKISKNDIVLAERLIQEAQKKGDYKTAAEMVVNAAVLGSELGQSIQAFTLVHKLTPEGRLMAIEKIVNRENKTNRTLQKRKQKVEVSDIDKKAILQAKGQEDLDAAVDNAVANVASQLPLTKADKIRSWRYLSMLGNPRTHMRNIIANVAMKGTTKVKNILAKTMEDIIKPSERTKTWKKSSKAVKDFVKNDAVEMADRIQGQDKYDIKSKLNLKQRSFNNKILNKLAEGNSKLLNIEDIWFSTPVYKQALAGYITANNIDIKNPDPTQLEKGRQYAINQAQESTFRQASKLANAISRLERTNLGTQLGVGAILPFKRTPINIAKTGIQYSPIGLTNGIYQMVKDAREGKSTAQSIDTLAKGMTGTGLTALGYFMASLGLLRGGGSDENKEEYFQRSTGEQPYSIRLGSKTYTLDWLSPTAMPLFAGVEAYEMLSNGKKADTTTVMSFLEGMSTITDPLTEMSLLQGINRTLKSYSSNALGGVVLNTAQNYLGQFIPTILGQLARTIDDTRRSTTGTGTGVEKTLNTFLKKQQAKIPFASQGLEPYTDIFGNPEKTDSVLQRSIQNFLSPGYIKDVNKTKISKEIQKLYDATGEKGVLPNSAARYFVYNGKKITLTPKEYTEFNKTDGQYVTQQLNNLFKIDGYSSATEEEKIAAIERIYRAGQVIAKEKYLRDRLEK